MSGWPATLRSKPVTLQAVSDLARAPEWLGEAEQAVLGKAPGCALAPLISSAGAAGASSRNREERTGYWIRVQDEGETLSIGALAASIEVASTDDEAEGATLVWQWLAVGAAWRAFGYGGAAVPIVERAAAKRGAKSARVRVPASNGVALYFWLRLGYRPMSQAAWPAPLSASAGTWMVRDRL